MNHRTDTIDHYSKCDPSWLANKLYSAETRIAVLEECIKRAVQMQSTGPIQHLIKMERDE